MTNNVVGLRGQAVVIPDRNPDQAVVGAARQLLEMAESGEIKGLAFVTHYGDGSTGRGRAGVLSYSMAGRLNQVIAEIIEALGKL